MTKDPLSAIKVVGVEQIRLVIIIHDLAHLPLHLILFRFEQAIECDPDYALAYKVLGSAHGITIQLGISKNPRETIKRTIELHRKAIELDDSLAIAHTGLGFWSLYARQHDTAIAEGRRGFEIDPNSAEIKLAYGGILTFIGRPKEAVPLLVEALRLNPKPPTVYLRFLAIALRDSDQYEDAIVDIGVTPVFTSPASINIYNLFCGRVPVIGTAAFVGVFDNSFHIFVFEDGRLKFYKGKKRGFKDENVFEQIKKTFLFFSMHFPDMQIGEYYFSGRRNIGNGDVEKLYEMLGPEVFVLDASDFVSLGDDVRIDDDAMAGIPGDLSVVSLLSPALGAAVEM